MRRPLLIGATALLATALASPVAAQDGGSPSTTACDPTATSTSAPCETTTTTTTAPPSSTVPTLVPPSSTTTQPEQTTTAPPEDPAGHGDAPPPSEVPISDETIPPPPGEPVDGAAAQNLIRRELRVAEAEAVQSQEAVAEAAALVDQLSDRLATLQAELAKLGATQELTVARLEAAQERFEERVANAVVRGNAAQLDTLISSTDSYEALTRKTLLESVTEADNEAVFEYRQAKEVVDDAVLEAVQHVSATRRELRQARKRLENELFLNAERRFQLAVFSAGSEIVIQGFVFPVGEPYSFIDSWGYPRMTGTEYEHGHQGSDIMAPFDTPLYAAERGVIIRLGTDVLGGTKLWVKGQSGTYYYYAHMQSYADGIVEGTLVEAGDVVGFVGNSGNAQGGPPHVHFQVHPDGGEPVNPYGLLKVVSDLSRR
jgi:murein DD-endopeptidase MepM/ murein hydrolase activator NlpD